MEPVSKQFIGISQQRWQNIIKAAALNGLNMSNTSGEAECKGGKVTYLYKAAEQTLTLSIASDSYSPPPVFETPQALLDHLANIVYGA